ncbi:hypothetical protein HDU91_004983 [Kappamyces sp. JEL0680]|nr:hypothetical protein HDU91_004983 [Kappamyces sp. JEL0680]
MLLEDFQLLLKSQHPKSALVNGREMHFTFRKSKEDTKLVLLMLPGNPGIPKFYDIFLDYIHGALEHVDIWCPSYVEMHLSCDELVEQLLVFFDTLIQQYPSGTNFAIAAHSLGAYLTVRIMEKRPQAPVVKIISLFPSLQQMASTPRGLQVAPITLALPRFLISLFAFALSAIPVVFTKNLAMFITGHPEPIIDALVDHLFKMKNARAVLYLASWEMNDIRELDVATIRRHQHIWLMYFGKGDGWCPEEHVRDIRSRLEVESYLCEEGHDHAFVTQNGGLDLAEDPLLPTTLMSIKESLSDLPATYKKIVVHTLHNDFDKATKVVVANLQDLLKALKPNQVLVKYEYVGINASDINFTAGRYDPSLKPPFDAGFEAIGRVVATGTSTKTKLHQPVAVMLYGCFSEYQLVAEKLLIPIPSLNKQFLPLIVSGLTSELALKHHGQMKKNEIVLVTAAAGGAGQIAVQLAKQAGNFVIGTCSTGKEAFLKDLGVDRVVNYKKENLAQVLKKEFPTGVDIVFESVGGEMFSTCMKALAVKGRLIVIGAVSEYATKVAEGEKMNTFNNWQSISSNILLAKSTTITGFFLNHYASEFPRSMKALTDLTLAGKLKPAVHPQQFEGLESVSDAIKCMHSGKNIGKVVVKVGSEARFSIYPLHQEKPSEPFRTVVVKLLSVDPANYTDAPREGIRRVLEIATGRPHPRDQPVDTSNIELVRMGTTVATNALLERKGEPTVLLITKGFKDLLRIGNQARPHLFDLSIKSAEVLFQKVIEVPERVTLVGYSSVKSGLAVDIPANDPSYVQGITKEWVHILQEPDMPWIESELQKVRDAGINSAAICLMHAYTYPAHEIQLARLCEKLGFSQVSLSSATSPMIKIVPRGTSTTADAYLTPCIKAYLRSFFSGFDAGMREPLNGKPKVKVEFMQSDGGLVDVDSFNGFKAILSGPAGGVVGYATTSWKKGRNAVIGFDMGGTSTDVSRFGGRFEHVFETTTAGVTIQAPQLDISTVAAGGGSRLYFQNGMFVVGPESASADPGPVCYRKGGPLAITDANLLLGRLNPNYFPKIFGKSEKEPLDLEATTSAFKALAVQVNEHLSLHSPDSQKMSLDEIAYGFIKVANEAMCRPIRALTQGKGYNTADHVLSCFGGAGGQHAFAIARSLGIHMILIHKYSSILSAYGQALADVVHEVQEPSAHVLSPSSRAALQESSQRLIASARSVMVAQGFPESHITVELYLNLRYFGTDTAIMTLKPENDSWDFETVFLHNYRKEFGFVLPDRDILVDDIRVRCIGRSFATGSDVKWTSVYEELETIHKTPVQGSSEEVSIYWEGPGRVTTPLYLLKKLKPGDEIHGPAIIIDDTATIAVEPFCRALVTSEHVVGFVGTAPKPMIEGVITCDPILLSVFGHRFMSIAEQMGRTMQKTSISTNIKERLDFSCALFGPDGGLVGRLAFFYCSQCPTHPCASGKCL